MKTRFEKFYEENYTNGFVMKKDIKKSWLGCKKEVIKLLKNEARDITKGGSKFAIAIIRRAIRLIEDKI